MPLQNIHKVDPYEEEICIHVLGGPSAVLSLMYSFNFSCTRISSDFSLMALLSVSLEQMLYTTQRRFLARILKMPVQNSNSKSSACADLASNIL